MLYRYNKKKNEKPLFDITGAKIKKKPDLKTKLDKEFSLFIRLRDAMPNGYFKCISCGQIKPFEQADNGHYINRHPALPFCFDSHKYSPCKNAPSSPDGEG